MLYTPLILDNANWNAYKSRLHLYPLRISKLNRLESSISVKSISLKYVLSGKEKYSLDKKEYYLGDNQFVITNKFSDCSVHINEKTVNTGICLDLDEDYFSDIIHSIYSPNDIDNLDRNKSFFLSNDLFSQGYPAEGNLKTMLQSLVSVAENRKGLLSHDDFRKSVSYEIIINQQKIIKEYNNISATRSKTKKELYSRLLKAQQIMTDAGSSGYSMKEIARMVCLSEFRFFHLFRKTFGITPFRFQTRVMMNHALKLFSSGNFTWTDVAEKTGYADLQAFSKVFKKVFGVSPKNFNRTSSVQRKNIFI